MVEVFKEESTSVTFRTIDPNEKLTGPAKGVLPLLWSSRAVTSKKVSELDNQNNQPFRLIQKCRPRLGALQISVQRCVSVEKVGPLQLKKIASAWHVGGFRDKGPKQSAGFTPGKAPPREKAIPS